MDGIFYMYLHQMTPFKMLSEVQSHVIRSIKYLSFIVKCIFKCIFPSLNKIVFDKANDKNTILIEGQENITTKRATRLTKKRYMTTAFYYENALLFIK